MIPDDAVEAAWTAFYAGREDMGAALEAAAPHIMASAWEEGRDEGYADAQRGYDLAANPYRKPGHAV